MEALGVVQQPKKADFLLYTAIGFLILSFTMPWFGPAVSREIKFGAFDGTVSRFEISVNIWLLVLFALAGAILCLTRVREWTSAPRFFPIGLLIFSLVHTSVVGETSFREFTVYSGYLCGQIGILTALAVAVIEPCIEFYQRRKNKNVEDPS